MNEDIERLKNTARMLIGINNVLSFLAGAPEHKYELRGCELYRDGEPFDEEIRKQSDCAKKHTGKCMIFDIKTKKRIV